MEKQEMYKMTKTDYENLKNSVEELGVALKSSKCEERNSLIWRINQLYDRISNAEIIECGNNLSDTVELGDTVTFVTFDEEETKQLVAIEGNPLKGTISLESNLGKALFNHKIGEEIPYKTLDSIESVKIVGIAKANNELTAAPQKTLR